MDYHELIELHQKLRESAQEAFSPLNENYSKEDDERFLRLFQMLYSSSQSNDYDWVYGSLECFIDRHESGLNSHLAMYIHVKPKHYWELQKNQFYPEDSMIRTILTDDLKWISQQDKFIFLDAKYLLNRKYEYIRNKIQNPDFEGLMDQKKSTKRRVFPDNVFKDYESYDLFSFLILKMGKNNASISFLYRILSEYDPTRIHVICGKKEFISFCYQDLGVIISKIKTLETVKVDLRLTRFNSLYKEFFETNSVEQN